MCGFNPLIVQRLIEERVKDALREAERTRLRRAAKSLKKAQGRRLSASLISSYLLDLVARLKRILFDHRATFP